MLSKADQARGATATHYAQGGIAVVLPHNDDSVEAHVADTVVAGAGLCDPQAVYSIVADGYAAVSELVGDGARFDESAPGQWALTREGGHSRRRIVHAGARSTTPHGCWTSAPRTWRCGCCTTAPWATKPSPACWSATRTAAGSSARRR